MKTMTIVLCAGFAPSAAAATRATEVVYVETSLDTDNDGRLDRIYVQVDRPAGATNLPTIMTITPYAQGGNDAPNHGVDVARLPQDESAAQFFGGLAASKLREDDLKVAEQVRDYAFERGYAAVSAHSIGTGKSTGCPTVGDEVEVIGTKAVIDWLNGRARAFNANGQVVTASWANGAVGMTGVSYNGTLPNMVATTGVEGLKAIVPVSAISSWYDYYRANGLVVGPGGYIGEDADVLGKFIVRGGAICNGAIRTIADQMGREDGDFTQFWQDRDYAARADGVRAAVFIMHGQADWNVKERHAIRWWQALHGRVPLKMWLHKGGHGLPSRAGTNDKMFAWFDRYVRGIQNGIENEPVIDVETPGGSWTTQQEWPHEMTSNHLYYLNAGAVLADTAAISTVKSFVDNGRTTRLDTLVNNPTVTSPARLAFVMQPLAASRLLSGTTRVTLDLAVSNRRASNITVAVVDYDAAGRGKIVTRGWADPQNYGDLTQGELLVLGQRYQITFDLEPKQYTFASGHRIGVVVAATDYDYTLRPNVGTETAVTLGQESFVELGLSN